MRCAMPAPILPVIEAAAHWPERGALIGLDFGTKTIGVARIDADRRLATGVETISARPSRPIRRTCSRSRASAVAVGFVLGLPINMDGSEGPRAQSTRALPASLRPDRSCDRAVGRAPFDRGRRARIDRDGRQPPKRAEVIDDARRDVHFAGRARSLTKTARGSLTMAVVIGALLPVF